MPDDIAGMYYRLCCSKIFIFIIFKNVHMYVCVYVCMFYCNYSLSHLVSLLYSLPRPHSHPAVVPVQESFIFLLNPSTPCPHPSCHPVLYESVSKKYSPLNIRFLPEVPRNCSPEEAADACVPSHSASRQMLFEWKSGLSSSCD